MLNLANAINAQGDRAEAEERYRDVLQKFQSTLGPDHPYTLKSQMALANVVNAQGKCSEAEGHFRRVLQNQRRVLGAEHPDTLYSMNALAWFLSVSAPPEQRNPEEAVELSKEAPSHKPDNVSYLRTLGQAQYRAGDWHEAIRTLNRSLELRGANQHDYITLALVHWHLGQKDQARILFENANGRKPKSKYLQQLHAEMATLLESENASLRTDNTAG